MENLKNLNFYKCEICGNISYKVCDSGNSLSCCGRVMTPMMSESTDGDPEVHVPVCVCKGTTVCVTVGAKDHPMTEGHHIEFISIITDRGVYMKTMAHAGHPSTCFEISDGEKVLLVKAFCNLHGMFEAECNCIGCCDSKSDNNCKDNEK